MTQVAVGLAVRLAATAQRRLVARGRATLAADDAHRSPGHQHGIAARGDLQCTLSCLGFGPVIMQGAGRLEADFLVGAVAEGLQIGQATATQGHVIATLQQHAGTVIDLDLAPAQQGAVLAHFDFVPAHVHSPSRAGLPVAAIGSSSTRIMLSRPLSGQMKRNSSARNCRPAGSWLPVP